jgi:hypothetical protein
VVASSLVPVSWPTSAAGSLRDRLDALTRR